MRTLLPRFSEAVDWRRALVAALAAALVLCIGPADSTAADASRKVIVVSLSRQQLDAYEGDALVLSTPVTTGRPDMPTPAGIFTIQRKDSPHLFTSIFPPGSAYYYKPISSEYAMYFLPPGYYIHDAPWRPSYGPGTNDWHIDAWGRRRTGSLGCVNVPGEAMRTLYKWASVGTEVVIQP